ncbi:ABC transporter [Dietzia sp. SLG310A2-38A2]|uniref:glycosyltransferase family 39 protein n=1 Tax=Dietzia sp. SLG310A2-38A2 TaxID=1630643 RepID=UPI0015F87038|nr:ABC transporter [Dietzia sp. SLG310A2-38A2]
MRTRPLVLFTAFTVLYLAVGLYLSLGANYLQGDALSRVADTRAALLSRDPHLAAIGFIFTPLTALAQLPLVGLSEWFPALTRWSLTAVAVSAPAMAGAVTQIHALARERRCPSWFTWGVTLVFGLHPMIVYYGANGMSEALFVFFVVWAVRRLVRWMTTDDVHDLMVAGFALGMAYLARYDALAASGTATLVVAAVSYRRSRRTETAILDGVILAAPTALAFLAWAATSWLVTGSALAQFSSRYGNAAILEQSGGGSTGGLSALAFSAAEIVVLAPALGVVLLVSVALAVRRRDPEPLAAVVLVAVLGFAVFTYLRGMTFPFLRFYISAVPLLVVLAVFCVPRGGTMRTRRPGPLAAVRPQDTLTGGRVVPVAVLLLLVAGVPLSGAAMVSPTLSQEQHALHAVILPESGDRPAEVRLQQEAIVASFDTERRLADYLDSLGLPEGAVIMDTVHGFPIIASTTRPEQFVIPSDRDFVEILNDPAANGVRFLLTVPAEGRGTSDALNLRYPTVHENGAQLGSLEFEVVNSGSDRPTWRLWRVFE